MLKQRYKRRNKHANGRKTDRNKAYLRATFGAKVTPDEFEKFEAAWTVAKRANTSETNKPVRWSSPEGRANMLLAQLTVF